MMSRLHHYDLVYVSMGVCVYKCDKKNSTSSPSSNKLSLVFGRSQRVKQRITTLGQAEERTARKVQAVEGNVVKVQKQKKDGGQSYNKSSCSSNNSHSHSVREQWKRKFPVVVDTDHGLGKQTPWGILGIQWLHYQSCSSQRSPSSLYTVPLNAAVDYVTVRLMNVTMATPLPDIIDIYEASICIKSRIILSSPLLEAGTPEQLDYGGEEKGLLEQ